MKHELIKAAAPTLQKIAGIVTGRDPKDVEALVSSELGFLEQRVKLDKALQGCTEESLIDCVKQSIRTNLSLNKQAGLVYLFPQPINTGTKDSPKWVTIATFEPSPDGRLSIARQSGRILDAKRPVVTKDDNGRVIGGYVDLLKPSYPQPRWESIDFDESDIDRWKGYSAKKNKGYANALYASWKGGIDPEFMRAKMLKHALGKMGVNINEGMALQIEEVAPMVEPSQEVETALTVDAIEEVTPIEEEPQNFDEWSDL